VSRHSLASRCAGLVPAPTRSRLQRLTLVALVFAISLTPWQFQVAAADGLPPPRPAPGSGLLWPASGPITTYFGQVGWASPRGHTGLDIAAPFGAPVIAAAAGQVSLAGWTSGGYGNLIIIDHGNGRQTLYAHLSQINVQPGQWVNRGQSIGRIGSTGFSTGPHLHFEVRQDGLPRDPLTYLSRQ
jgi:murein DD-endopeptidase MepM/ murein hydrolase activator NlpD